MPARLLLADAHAVADALTYAGRTARLGDGAVRLAAREGVLVMTSAPLAPRGLFDRTPTILGLRALPADPELECDFVVDAESLSTDPGDSRAIMLPDTAVSAPWAGISPPRTGWTAAGRVAASVLASRAQWGIASVAEAMPKDAGEDAVRAVRASVWGEPDEALDGLPLGAAFAAFALGFIAGEEDAAVRTAGRWTRLTLVRGHVLVRGPARTGLTEVRTTGTAH